MSDLETKPLTDTWVVATWDEYVRAVEDPAYEKAKGYYYNGQMRIEMSPVGSDHASDHAMIIFAINLFATLRGIPFSARDNCTYRKAGVRECQLDVSYHVRERAQVIPWGTSIIDLNRYPAPDLAIEVAHTSLLDDQGAKRLLYEDLEVKEYWIVDVQNVRITAFAVADQGSRRIIESQVFPGLAISVLEKALRRSRQMDQSQVGAWLLAQFQP
jgi:Uma2 family endonuclease